MSGCCTRASTMARRFCHPPDNSVAGASRSSKPARPSVSAKRAPRSVPETPQRSRALAITERAVAPGMKRESCSTQARRVRLRNDTSPLSAAISPARILSSVDLPDPFGPIRPMRSPSEMVNETFWKSGFAPKAFVISCALTMGGNEVRSPGMWVYSEYQGTAGEDVRRTVAGTAALHSSTQIRRYDATGQSRFALDRGRLELDSPVCLGRASNNHRRGRRGPFLLGPRDANKR